MMKKQKIIVVGGGHAGCEAALAAARIGIEVLLFAINLDSIAMMPCNPCIGGSAKGHLVREIDALGGQMGKVIDRSFMQSRMLNKSKGPAVYSLRAQADKAKYSNIMKHTLENTKNLYLRQGEVTDILSENGKVTGIVTEYGTKHDCDALIICAGTYLNARCLCGSVITESGPGEMRRASHLSDVLLRLGIRLMRFKTGTPARILRSSIDFSKMAEQHGDVPVVPFSFDTPAESVQIPQITCHLTYTSAKTHEIIQNNLHRSPMYAGVIEGIGTRYCPSIEDKISRFADKERHQIFIEPEGAGTEEMYVQGMSTSLPEDVQEAMYQSVPGLEDCKIMRNGYAIEYDCIDAADLKLSLESKAVEGLFFAGQVNGTSGYEEAAAQGLIAGINAALFLKGEEALIIDRSTGYIGVLIDDLVTKGTKEPYRMMTSRAEYRLLLRQDNADLRLRELGFKVGLVPEESYKKMLLKKKWIESEIEIIKNTNIAPSAEINKILEARGSTAISTGYKLSDLIKRPELSYDLFKTDFPDAAWLEQVNIQVKYEGYIQMQLSQVASFKKLELKKISKGIDYNKITGMRIEARQKLSEIRPDNIGQASRISGVSPADINVLLVYMKAVRDE